MCECFYFVRIVKSYESKLQADIIINETIVSKNINWTRATSKGAWSLINNINVIGSKPSKEQKYGKTIQQLIST